MAEAKRTPNTSLMPALSLNEAVALVARLRPPHDAVAVEAEMGRGLSNGTLRDWFVEINGFVHECPTEPNTWRIWLEEDRVDWRAGVVTLPPRPGRLLKKITPPPFRPMFRRQDVLDYFGITEEASVRPPVSKKPSTPTKRWVTGLAERLKAEHKLSDDMSKTKLAELFEDESKRAAKNGEIKKPLTLRYIRYQLEPWGIWPISSIK
jgi:hypothetical protein